ncbi:hypothetical protein KFL_003220030 [Klebsormidium nitens]|uniref:Uncharacterized protein n=1 Tax=Klebsormidium nitens TaxID=105231 RepID=A0A1Y1ICW3_KLENI|nr:hypothetical protein KFL_003220030 [Klebsormidium nitens]|eukprot:GAQ86941.1 hypothetical protein KFL_003220030 [Klebsormidium nitens]
MNADPASVPLEGQKSDAHMIHFPNSEKPAAGKYHGIIPFEIAEGHDFFNKNKGNKYMAALKPLKQANLIPEGTYIYDASHPLRLLLRLPGTAVLETLKSYSFWMVMLTHLILVILYYKVDFQHTRIDSSNTPATQRSQWPFLRTTTYSGFLATLVSFCLVFQTTQSYNRYFKQYEAVVDMRRGAISFHQHIRSLFADDAFPGAREMRMKLHKYCLALFYCTYGWFPHYQEKSLNIWVFNYMCELELFTPEEKAELLSLSKTSKPHQWVSKWLTYTLYQEHKRGHLTARSLDRLLGYTGKIGMNINMLFEHVQMPVPFAFYHLLNLMAIGYLLLLAYTQVSASYFYSLVPLALTTLVTLGIRELSNALADPFGRDETDIPILDYVAKWHAEFDELLDYVPPGVAHEEAAVESNTATA